MFVYNIIVSPRSCFFNQPPNIVNGVVEGKTYSYYSATPQQLIGIIFYQQMLQIEQILNNYLKHLRKSASSVDKNN